MDDREPVEERLLQRPAMTQDARAAEDYYNRLRGLMPLEAFAQMQVDCGSMLAAISALQTAMASAATTAQITSLQGQINAANAAITALSTTVSTNTTQIANLIADMAKRPTVYLGSAQKSNVKLFTKSATTTSGVATFSLTDGAGAALFTNVYDESVALQVNDSTSSYAFSWSLSGDKKTLTVTAAKPAVTTILGISVLGALNPVPNGTAIRLTVWGD